MTISNKTKNIENIKEINNRDSVGKLLKNEPNGFGFSLSEISRRTGVNLDAVRIAIAQLEGAELIECKRVGQIKVARWKK